MPDTILDGSGEPTPGRRLLEGTDLEIAYNLLGDDLFLRVNKAGVQIFGVVLENAAKPMTAKQLSALKTERSDLVVSIGPRKDTVANVGFALGRVTSKLIKATREKIGKPQRAPRLRLSTPRATRMSARSASASRTAWRPKRRAKSCATIGRMPTQCAP